MAKKSNLKRTSAGAARAGGQSAQSPEIALNLEQGLALHQGGDLNGAGAAYQQVLRRAPQQPDALHLLGVVHHQTGDHAGAVDLIRRAIRINGSNGHAHMNLGAALHALGRFDEAAESFETAAARLPGNAEVFANLAAVHVARGDRGAALTAYQRAIEYAPTNVRYRLRAAELLLDLSRYQEAVGAFRAYLDLAPGDHAARNNLGVALEQVGDFLGAETQFRIVTEQRPDLPEGHANLANVLAALGRFADSEAGYRRALELAPTKAEFHASLGNLLFETDRVDEARAAYQRALALKPDDFNMWLELGIRLSKARRYMDAIAAFKEAIRVHPESADAHNNMAAAHCNLMQFEQGIEAFKEAIRLKPDLGSAYVNLCTALEKLKRYDEAVVHAWGLRLFFPEAPALCDARALTISRHICDFDGIADLASVWDAVETFPREEKASMMLSLLAMTDDDEKLARHFRLARQIADVDEKEARRFPLPALVHRASSDGKIRLGFVSSDFREHSVSKFILPLFRHYDRSRFEITCYSALSAETSPVQAEIKGLVDSFVPIDTLTDRAAAQRIREDGTDIAFDLNGYTSQSRLPIFAYRAAPSQAAWIGWPATTGQKEMDYLIVDRFSRPTQDDVMTERPLVVPGAFLCFESFPEMAIEPPPFERKGHVTFGTLNATYKYSREVIGLWAAVMNAVENSRIVIVRPEATSMVFVSNMMKEFASHGIGPDRLDVFDNQRRGIPHLACYNLFDISLDTFPVTGGTTTADALWMGVPVVTRMGPAFHQRVSGSILQHCGLADLCTETPEEFVRTAVTLAHHRQHLADLRDTLRSTLLDSPLCRAEDFTRSFEATMTKLVSEQPT